MRAGKAMKLSPKAALRRKGTASVVGENRVGVSRDFFLRDRALLLGLPKELQVPHCRKEHGSALVVEGLIKTTRK